MKNGNNGEFHQTRLYLLLSSYTLFRLKEKLFTIKTMAEAEKKISKICSMLEIDFQDFEDWLRFGDEFKSSLLNHDKNRSFTYVGDDLKAPFGGYFIPVTTQTTERDVRNAFKAIEKLGLRKILYEFPKIDVGTTKPLVEGNSRKDNVDSDLNSVYEIVETVMINTYLRSQIKHEGTLSDIENLERLFSSAIEELADELNETNDDSDVNWEKEVNRLTGIYHRVSKRFSLPTISDLDKIVENIELSSN